MTEFENRSGVPTIVNSQVRQGSAEGSKAVYIPRSPQQVLIETSPQDALYNGELIGTVDGVSYFNSINRFTNPYSNKFKGWMFVADAAYNCNPQKTLRVAATAGYASGDKNPNQDFLNPNDSAVDGDFKGFIGLQELYSGSRVQSVFLLGGTGKVPRPLAIPVSTAVADRVPSTIIGFTNLKFVGTGVHWYPGDCGRVIGIRSNMLAYWQADATNAFDRVTGKSFPDIMARNYLGTEFNIFADVDLLKDFDTFKLFAVSSVFVPGTHFKDIRGTPLNKDELKLIESNDVTGILDDNNPLLSDNLAYTLNIGIECRF